MASAKPSEEQELLHTSLMRTDLKMGEVAEFLYKNVPTTEGRVKLMMILAELIRCGAPEELCATPLTLAQELLCCYLLFFFGVNVQAGKVASRLILDLCDNAFERPHDSPARVFLLYLIGGGIAENCSQYTANSLASRFFFLRLNVPSDAEETKLRAFILQDAHDNPAAPFVSQNPFIQSAFAGIVQDSTAGISVDAMMQSSAVNTDMALQKLLNMTKDVYAPSLPLSFAPITPPLLELGDDELSFTYPTTSCDKHALDMSFPVTRPTPRDALLLACNVPLTQKQFDKLHDLMVESEHKCPISAIHAAAPRVLDMIKNNPNFVPFFICRVESTNNSALKSELCETLCSAPISLPILEVVFEAYKLDASMPSDLLIKFSRSLLRKCQSADESLSKKGKRSDAEIADANDSVNYVAKFFTSLFSVPSACSIIQKKDASLLSEIQDFSIKFSKLSEPAKLYEAIRKHPRA